MSRISKHVALFLLALLVPLMSQATSVHWVAKQVGRILPPDSRDCIFFELTGVSEADPVVPNVTWFVVPRAQNGFKEIYSLLLMAKATGMPLTVETTGAAVSTCANFVGVWQIYTTS